MFLIHATSATLYTHSECWWVGSNIPTVWLSNIFFTIIRKTYPGSANTFLITFTEYFQKFPRLENEKFWTNNDRKTKKVEGCWTCHHIPIWWLNWDIFPPSSWTKTLYRLIAIHKISKEIKNKLILISKIFLYFFLISVSFYFLFFQFQHKMYFKFTCTMKLVAKCLGKHQ